MPLHNQEFQNYLANWVAEVKGLAETIETWADNKADTSPKDSFGNPTFDFTTAQADLETAKAALVSSVTTVTGL